MEKQVEPNIKRYLNDLREQLDNIKINKNEHYKEKLMNIIETINIKEKKLDLLIDKKNELQELENQLRHIEKKNKTYDIKEYEEKAKLNYENLSSNKIKKKLKQLAKILSILDEKDSLDLWNQLKSLLILRKKPSTLKNDGILIHLALEEYYIKRLINEKNKELENADFEGLKDDIKKLYLKEYIPISRLSLKEKIKENIKVEEIDEILNKINLENKNKTTNESTTLILDKIKNDLLNLYPIVLTTVDSVISNYYSYFYNNRKIDYIIIDEASQSDVLSAIPLLYLAENLIVVGDNKQLSAITDVKKLPLNNVEDIYDYTKENFLSTISKTMNPPSQMLLEHYRCDYNIINYCNKFFYNNELKIYTEAKKGAMALINVDKGKYVMSDKFLNLREIKTIEEAINYDITGKFIITPYRAQADELRNKYGESQCGTIHTFQGKGEKQVYFSSVLNETKKCVYHLNSENNLFTQELINVAVSRAKNKFVLVSDVNFFKKADIRMKNLIEYIEVYGDKIPDKTVCIFDYLYKQIPAYIPTIANIDNPYEEKVFYLLQNYLKDKEYTMVCKLPLAEFVTDKNYLDEHEDLKNFILNNSHLDFALYSKNINKPILAIEVDGEQHYSDEKQKERDKKKEEILNYMEIPLLRISSKVAWDNAEFKEQIDKKLCL